jgi:hypothetical protein
LLGSARSFFVPTKKKWVELSMGTKKEEEAGRMMINNRVQIDVSNCGKIVSSMIDNFHL